jgi:predicted ribonuclease YlaK
MPAQQQQRLNKRQKRLLRQQGILEGDDNRLSSRFGIRSNIAPMTDNQRIAFDSWDEGYHLMLHGIAGTGKTFLGLYFALSQVLDKRTPYQKVYIVRSTVPTRDQGFLPGSQKQKEAVYESAYVDIANELFDRGDAYSILKQKDIVRFTSTSFLRGTTFKDCIIVVDEVQNMSDQELHTVMTRIGENARIIFCGDVKQDDLTSERKKEMSGLRNFMRVINNMKEFDFIEFQAADIVRSQLVKSYIIERDKLGL